MPYILDDNDRVTIGRRPVTVTVTCRDGAGVPLPEGAVQLEAWSGEVAARPVLHPRPSTLVLPRVDQPVVLRVVPGYGDRQFRAGVILDVTLRTERSRTADEDVVVVRDVEVSGFFRELLRVEVLDAGRLSVTAIDKVTDPQIPPLAQAARAAARYRLGVERTAEAHDLLVAVDMSSSMTARFDDGSVTALVDVVVGLSQVVGHGRALDVVLLADRPVRVRAAGPLELAERTRATIRETGRGCGFRSAPREPGVGRGTIVYVVTDAVPVDVAALRAARERGENRCLVVAGDGRRSRAAGDVPTAVLRPPRPLTDATTHLSNEPDELAEVVGAMLAAAGVSR